MLGRKVIYVRCVVKSIRLLDKKAILVFSRKIFTQVRAFERYIPLNCKFVDIIMKHFAMTDII